MTTAWAIGFAVRMVCAARLVSTAELVLRWSQTGPSGLLNYRITEFSSPLPKSRLGQPVETRIRWLNRDHFGALVAVDACLSAALLVRPQTAALIALAAISQLWIMKRSYLANDGADQLTFIILVTAALGSLSDHALGAWAAVSFLAAQACLAYFVSGIYKASSSRWVRGDALAGILSTRAFGDIRVGRLINNRRWLALASTWIVLIWECCFATSLLAPMWLLIVMLTLGVVFHLSCGVFMGLTNFLLAFTATYPSVVLVNRALRAHVPAVGCWLLLAVCLASIAVVTWRTVTQQERAAEPRSRPRPAPAQAPAAHAGKS
jgi:hypothetical protein